MDGPGTIDTLSILLFQRVAAYAAHAAPAGSPWPLIDASYLPDTIANAGRPRGVQF